MQVSKFPGWYQKIPQITVILLTITTLVVVEWWWWHHHHHYNTTTITLYHHHHHSTTTVTIKFSCVAIYAVLLQNYFCLAIYAFLVSNFLAENGADVKKMTNMRYVGESVSHFPSILVLANSHLPIYLLKSHFEDGAIPGTKSIMS